MKTILLSFALLLALQASDCATAGSIQDSSVTRVKRQMDAEAQCPRHSDHQLADPHAHNEYRAKLGLPPSEWAEKEIAKENEAYRKCVEAVR